MITVKTESEIKILREGGKILREILEELANLAKPGVSTEFLNSRARELIFSAGGRPSFEGYTPAKGGRPYPAALCASLNEVVVHGLPSERLVLKEGDVLKLDLGLIYKNLFTDSALTVPVGRVDGRIHKLIEVTKKSLELGISKIKPGAHIGDIGEAIEAYVKSQKMSVIRGLVGHGVGYKVHEEPSVPNYGRIGHGPVLKSGMVIAVEPMVTWGSGDVFLTTDGLSYATSDNSPAAHFEHTVAVTEEGNIVLTR